MQEFVYRYRLVDIQDGSTFFGWMDLGMDQRVRKKVRLVNIKCYKPEIKQGKDAKKFITELLDGRQIYIKTFRDRFRRWSTILAVMYYYDEQLKSYVNVNDLLVKKEFAEDIGEDIGNRVEKSIQ
jgi:hypothetical protein